MSPSYLAALVRCLGVLSWRNAWFDYGYIFASSGAVLWLVVDMSVAVQRQGFGQTVEKTVGSAVAFLVVVAVPVGRSCRFSGASVKETVVSHRCSLSARVFGQGR